MEHFNRVLIYLSNFKFEIFIGLLTFYLMRKLISSFFKRPNVPGPFPWPIVGNALSLGSQPHISMQAMAQKYGSIFLMKLGSTDVLVLNDYDSIKEALGRQRTVFMGRPKFETFKDISQGKSIAFNSPDTMGENWQKMKTVVIRHLHKFISGKDTRTYLAEHVRRECIEMVRTLDEMCKQSRDGVVDVGSTLDISLANIICALMFGHRYHYENKEFQDLVSLNQEFGEVVGAGSQLDVMPWIKIFPKFRRTIETFDFLNRRMNNWMISRTSEHKENYVHGVARNVVDTFFAESVDNPAGLMKDDIITALTTDIFGAGQDTLSTAVQWVFSYMIFFPDVQKKVHDEIDSILGDDCLPETFDKQLFPYTEAVMHEIFRHTSFTATTIPHMTTQDTTLRDYYIPKETLVFINQYAANHDPRYWDSPDEFRPERFLNEKGQVLENAHNTYMLFSFGSRKCPGDELTRSIILHLIVMILKLCCLQPDPKTPATLDSIFSLSNRPKSLKTRLLMRKPKMFNVLKSRVSEINPDIQTINSIPGSLDSSVPHLDANRNEVHTSLEIPNLSYSDRNDDHASEG